MATGGTPEFVRLVPSGGDDISRTLERSLGISFHEAEQDKVRRGLQGGATTPREVDAEHLVRENVAGLIESIRNTLNFYANAHPGQHISSVVLAGGGSRLAGLGAVLSRALGIATTHVDPLDTFTVRRKQHAAGVEKLALELAAPLGVTVGGK
ncbi:pilus assembly protein PilM [Microbacterium sp.]|uniref:pilus assembly protein PilM n=1 Tax=Microbacterium sp. TaxID=51671 RepID=UPI0039E243E0